MHEVVALLSAVPHRRPPGQAFFHEERGVTAIEVGLLIAALIAALTARFDALSSNFDLVSSAMTGAI